MTNFVLRVFFPSSSTPPLHRRWDWLPPSLIDWHQPFNTRHWLQPWRARRCKVSWLDGTSLVFWNAVRCAGPLLLQQAPFNNSYVVVDLTLSGPQRLQA